MDKRKRTYAIVGTGAVGGFYGAKLSRAGFDVHFLLHNDYEHVRMHGLKIDSKAGSFMLPHVNAYRSPHDMPPAMWQLSPLKPPIILCFRYSSGNSQR